MLHFPLNAPGSLARRVARGQAVLAARTLALSCLGAALLLGCDDAAERQSRAEARARLAKAAADEAAQKNAALKAEEDKLEEQKEAEASRQASQVALLRGAVFACCDGLARRGFEERSMEDMAAKKLCLERDAKGESIESVRDALQHVLEDRPLPPACMAGAAVTP